MLFSWSCFSFKAIPYSPHPSTWFCSADSQSRVCYRIFRYRGSKGEGHCCTHGPQEFVHQWPGDGEVRAVLQDGGHARVSWTHLSEQKGQWWDIKLFRGHTGKHSLLQLGELFLYQIHICHRIVTSVFDWHVLANHSALWHYRLAFLAHDITVKLSY